MRLICSRGDFKTHFHNPKRQRGTANSTPRSLADASGCGFERPSNKMERVCYFGFVNKIIIVAINAPPRNKKKQPIASQFITCCHVCSTRQGTVTQIIPVVSAAKTATINFPSRKFLSIVSFCECGRKKLERKRAPTGSGRNGSSNKSSSGPADLN